MPIYEYHCSTCEENFEVSQKISEGPLSACPKCAGTVQKLISHSSFVLKGTGWYKTDYADKSGKSGSSGKPNKSAAPACAAGGSKPACSGCPSAAD